MWVPGLELRYQDGVPDKRAVAVGLVASSPTEEPATPIVANEHVNRGVERQVAGAHGDPGTGGRRLRRYLQHFVRETRCRLLAFSMGSLRARRVRLELAYVRSRDCAIDLVFLADRCSVTGYGEV